MFKHTLYPDTHTHTHTHSALCCKKHTTKKQWLRKSPQTWLPWLPCALYGILSPLSCATGRALQKGRPARTHRPTRTHTRTRTHAYSIGQVRVIDPNCDEIAPKEHFASSPALWRPQYNTDGAQHSTEPYRTEPDRTILNPTEPYRVN